MAKNSSVNLDITNNADGFDISGGTATRKLTTTGADITLTGSGTNTQTMPSTSQTLVGRTSTDTLTNKTLTAPVINSPTGIVTNDVTESTNKNYVSDAELIVIGNTSNTNTGDQTLTESSKSITIESPTSSEDISMFFTSEAMTISKMACVLTGSSTPSVTWTVRHSTDRSAVGNEVVTSGTTTTSTTTGSIVTSFNDATVPANSFVWIETSASSGVVDTINLTIIYDAD